MKKVLYSLLFFIFFFSGINAQIKINSPNGGENWQKNTNHMVTWNPGGVPGNVIIQLLQGNISQGAIYNGPNSGNFNWKINTYLNNKPITNGQYKLQVKSLSNTNIKDQSNFDFNIISAATPKANIKVNSPNGGENWQINTNHNVTWNPGGAPGNVIIQLYQGGISRGAIYNGPNSGNFNWMINKYLNNNQIKAGSYKMQVKSLSDPSIKDQSDFNFIIKPENTNLKIMKFPPNQVVNPLTPRVNPNLMPAGQKMKFYSPRSGFVWKPMKDNEVTFEVFRQAWPFSSFYYDIKLVSATPNAYFKDIILKKNYQFHKKDTGNSFIYSFMWKFFGSYNVPTGNYKVVVQSISRPDLKGESEIFKVENTTSGGTGFLGETEADLKIEDVYYDYYKQSIAVRIRNQGFSHYSGEITIAYSFTFSKTSTYNDKNCAVNSDTGGKKFALVSIGKHLTKVLHFYDYKCFDKRPGDFLPRKGPMQYSVTLYHKGNKSSVKSGMICKTKKPDIIATSPIFIYTKHNTVTRVGPNLKGTLHPDIFNWTSKTQFKTKVSVDVMNWGCSSKTFDINLHMDGPYLNGKPGIKLGTITLSPGQEKHFISQQIVFSIPRSSKYERLLLVAYQGEKGDEGYPNAYMNNFLLANIRIYAESNTVRVHYKKYY